MNSNNILNNIQYFLSSFMAICFGLGFIPNYFDNVLPYLAGALILQILISILRGRLLNVFFEIFIVGLAGLSMIPVLGYFFRFLGVIFCILEMASLKNTILYKQIDMRVFKTGNFKEKSKKKNSNKSMKKPEPKFKDADFSEK